MHTNNKDLKKNPTFTLGRNNLSKIYITFVRLVLEYASVIWDGCNMFDMERLEKVQLCAARIVTG